MSGYYENYGGDEGNGYSNSAYNQEMDANFYPPAGAAGEEEALIPEEGIWYSQLSTMMDEVNNSVTCLEYDDTYERLWTGYKSGRVTSLQFDSSTDIPNTMQASRYCSFMSSQDEVVGLNTIGDFIVSSTSSEIRMHGNGGLPIARLVAPEVIESGGLSASAHFSCSALCHPGGFDSTPTHVLAGTKRNIAVVYDLNTFDIPMLTVDIGSPAVCCRENRYYNGSM